MKYTNKAVLIEGPIGKILFRLTVPMIFGILGMVDFNLVDTFFVGQLGELTAKEPLFCCSFSQSPIGTLEFYP
jgi:Na+-driven multidrug efflux pump